MGNKLFGITFRSLGSVVVCDPRPTAGPNAKETSNRTRPLAVHHRKLQCPPRKRDNLRSSFPAFREATGGSLSGSKANDVEVRVCY